MGKKKLLHFYFILKLLIFLQLFGNSQAKVNAKEIEIGTAVAKFQSEDDISLKARMIEIEKKSRQQDENILNLKIRGEEDKKIINRLEDRISRLEASVLTSKPKADGNLQRKKRLYRLLPPHQPIIGAIDKESDASFALNQPFYGPPTSCSDLEKLGYSLNGYYMVKKDGCSSFSKMSTVFCNFKRKENDGRLETLIGNVEIKTKSVHFFVQRNTLLNSNEIITFDIERLNVGEGMNLTSGLFTAPVPGIYHFQFSGCKDDSSGYLTVHLHLNGNQISYGNAGRWGGSVNKELTVMNEIHVLLRLKMGDQVNIVKDGTAALADYIQYPMTHFTGSLLEEDLELA